MNDEKHNIMFGLRKITHFSEGVTSLIAGTYVLSLALTKRNLALRLALGITGGYLILRSGIRLHSGSFDDEATL